MWKKIASLAALLSTSLTVQGCSPIVYKPIPMRDAKVPKIVKVPTPARPKTEARTPQRLISAPPRMNVYGQPQ